MVEGVLSEEERRAQKLLAAKKKLKSFRASRHHTPTVSISTSTNSTRKRSTRSPNLSISICNSSIQPASNSGGSSSSSSSTTAAASIAAAAPFSSSNAENTWHSASHSRRGSHSRQLSKGRLEDSGLGLGGKSVLGPSSSSSLNTGAGHRHRRSNSNASGMIPTNTQLSSVIPSSSSTLHRKQKSSISRPTSHTTNDPSTNRASLAGLFDFPREQLSLGASGPGSILPPREIITTPATPLMKSPQIDDDRVIYPQGSRIEEEIVAVKARMSAFSFGAKPNRPSSPSSPSTSFPSPSRRSQDPFASPSHHSSTELSSPSRLNHPSPKSASSSFEPHRMSSPSPRPPSVLLTAASPFWLNGLTSEQQARHSIPSPSSSPGLVTPQRKRHSHNRSDSISMPNLKLGRSSLIAATGTGGSGTPNSPSSPAPDSNRSRLSGPPINGTRLKFEPSGRGAEADKEKEEYRRRALEKLTGVACHRQAPQAQEIALPSFDDDDSSSIGSSSGFSSTRLSGVNLNLTDSSAQPSSFSSPLASSPLPWSEDATITSWAGFPNRSFFDSKVSPFSPDTASNPLPTTRASLCVVTEEDETEPSTENERPTSSDDNLIATSTQATEPPVSMDPSTNQHLSRPSLPDDNEGPVGPTASRLKQLHLVSTTSTKRRNSADGLSNGLRSFALSNSSSTTSQKGYGNIGRGRPRPLSGLASSSSSTIASTITTQSSISSPATTITTPQSASSAHKNKNSGTIMQGSKFSTSARRGNRSSSISYRKEGESPLSHSSRDWTNGGGSDSTGSRGGLVSPPLGTLSPTSISSPKLLWISGQRYSGIGSRPCPRPRSLVGLGLGAAAASSNRILGEVDEADEENNKSQPKASGKVIYDAEGDEVAAGLVVDIHHRLANQGERVDWATSRDRVDLEMERDALRDDVELWRGRCKTLEERLEAERKESALLRDRVRKLGDRLLTVSAAHPTSHPPDSSDIRGQQDSRLVGEMRSQLLALSATLERERQERINVETRLAEVEAGARGAKTTQIVAQSQTKFQPMLPSALFTYDQQFSPTTATSQPGPLLSPFPSSPSPSSGLSPASPDSGAGRMRTWGFPKGPVKQLASKESKRESFFGLSATPRPKSTVDETGEGNAMYRGIEKTTHKSRMGTGPGDHECELTGGIDLPHFFVDESMSQFVIPSNQTVSDATSLDIYQTKKVLRSVSSFESKVPNLKHGLDSTEGSDFHLGSGSASPPGSGSGSALSFLSNFLGGAGTTRPENSSSHLGIGSQAVIESGLGSKLGGIINGAGHILKGSRFGLLEEGGTNNQLTIASGLDSGRLDWRCCCKSCRGDIIEL